MRERIFKVIELADPTDRLSQIYDYFMMAVIIASLVPLAFKENLPVFQLIDRAAVTIFIIDYFLRLLTADFKFQKHAASSFLRYPFSFLAIVDLISILPSLTVLNGSLKLLRVFRMVRAMRVFRVLRYSKSVRLIFAVFRDSKNSLITVGTLAVGYILLSALVVFNVEPDTFTTFFDAVYWATVSLMAVGYGDIYPVSVLGRGVTMLSALFGIAIVALPAGIITAGYMTELRKIKDDDASRKLRGEEQRGEENHASDN